jgi:type VI secretion system protein ImpF
VPTSDYDVRVVPSVLDRLVDDDPRSSRDIPGSRAESVRELKRAVQQDLEVLLNSRNAFSNLPADFVEVGHSALTFGLPDLASYNISSANDQTRLRLMVETAIQHFEPRLAATTVMVLPGNTIERSLRLRIESKLLIDPTPEAIAFDVVVPLMSREYQVKESG